MAETRKLFLNDFTCASIKKNYNIFYVSLWYFIRLYESFSFANGGHHKLVTCHSPKKPATFLIASTTASSPSSTAVAIAIPIWLRGERQADRRKIDNFLLLTPLFHSLPLVTRVEMGLRPAFFSYRKKWSGIFSKLLLEQLKHNLKPNIAWPIAHGTPIWSFLVRNLLQTQSPSRDNFSQMVATSADFDLSGRLPENFPLPLYHK